MRSSNQSSPLPQKHHLKYDTTPSLLNATPPASKLVRTVRIEFDGGTPCNIPRLGYGDGYGSYKIDDEPIYRLNYRVPMSANVAEITTLRRAIESVAQTYGKQGIALDIHGDSQIALKWARGATESGRPAKMKKKTLTEPFMVAVLELQRALEGFASVTATWRGREASVRLFGH